MNNSDRSKSDAFPLTNNSYRTPAVTGAQPDRVSPSRRARPRTAWTYTKRALATFFCVLCLCSGTYIGNLYWRSKTFRDLAGTWLSHLPSAIMHGDPMVAWTPTLQFPEDKQSVLNLLLLGCDADYDERKPIALKGNLTRSDAIMVAKVDFANREVHILSIPRDTAVVVPGHGYQKINAAHALGGPELTQRTIQETFGIHTDYWLTIDFQGFQKIVDAVGGVVLDVPKRLKYDDNWGNLHVDLHPGVQRLTGYQAMGFVRIRKLDDDLQRAQRQRDFLAALKAQVQSRETFLKLPEVLNAVSDSIKSNMTTDQILTLSNFARQLSKSAAGTEAIQSNTLPVIEGPSYVYTKSDQAKEVIAHLFFDDNPLMVTINVPGQAEWARSSRRGEHREDSRRPRGRRSASKERTTSTEEGDGDLMREEHPAGADATSGDETPSRLQEPTDDLEPSAPKPHSPERSPAPDTGKDKGDKKDGDAPDGGTTEQRGA